MDNLQYKDETQNMAKVSLQKGITIHQPSWLSSRIWKIRNYRALQHNCKLFKQKRRYKINLKKKRIMRLVLSFQYLRLCIWYQQYWPCKLRQKDVRQLSRKKKGNLGFHGKAVFRNLVKFYTTKAF